MPEQPVRRAASVVYNIPEIWRNVLSFMDLPTLSRVIALEKRGDNFVDVARELWGHGNVVFYSTRGDFMLGAIIERDSRSIFVNNPKRKAIYTNAITTFQVWLLHLNLQSLQMNFGMPDSASKGQGCMGRRRDWVRVYRPEVMPKVIDFVTKLGHRGIREIRSSSKDNGFRDTEGVSPYSWAVKFDPRPFYTSGGQRIVDHRVIDHVSSLTYIIHQSPPSGLPTLPLAPSPDSVADYSIRCSYNVRLSGLAHREYHLNEWRHALKAHPIFEKLHGKVSLGDLPVSFSDIVDLYQRNSSARRLNTIATICAYIVTSSTILDFQRLGGFNSNALTELRLATRYVSQHTSLSFADLPLLISTIRTSMPKLKKLAIALDGVETAETVCREFLSPNTLDSINDSPSREIIVYTARVPTPLFNTLRVLISLFSNIAFPASGLETVAWNLLTTTEFYKYLQKISSDRRRHLSDLDFASIGVNTVESLRALLKDDSELFQPPFQGKAKGWVEFAKKAKGSSDDLITGLELGVLDLSKHARRVEVMLPEEDVPAAEKLEEAEKLLASIRRIKEVAAQASKLLESDPEQDVERYISSLRRAV